MWIRLITFGCVAAALTLAGCSSGDTQSADSSGKAPLRWGSDESGGAPFEFRDPENPEKRIGFEVEIADEIGKRLGRPIEFVQTQWDTLIPALNRNDFDIAMSGLEITPERKEEAAFTIPYYVYTQQLVVRADQPQINSLADLKGHAVGTLAASAAERVLKQTPGIEVRSYDDNVRPYDDLEIGRVDGVLLDLPIAEYYAHPKKTLRFAGEPFAPGFYAIAVRKDDTKLLAEINGALEQMKKDGSLKAILTKWNLWNDAQTSTPQ